MIRLGVISDTHGRLRPRALELLAGCDRILHAGDVGGADILDALAGLAPVEAVRGNTDAGPWAAALPQTLTGEIGGVTYRVVHRYEEAAPSWLETTRLLVYGHSHRPELRWQGRCLLLNPGAAGNRRFDLPLTLAIVTVHEGRLVPEIRDLEPSPSDGRSP